jgi:hypothetical protein
MIDSKKKKETRGRPRGSRTTFIGKAIGLRLYPELESRLDAWVAEQDNPPSRPEAIRLLMQLGLDTWAASKAAPAPAEPDSAPKRTKPTKSAPPKKARPRRPA